MAETTTKAVLEVDDVPIAIRPVAQKWSEALSATFDLMHGELLRESDITCLFEIILETAGAAYAPSRPDLMGQITIVRMFAERLSVTCDQFIEDANLHEESRLATKQ